MGLLEDFLGVLQGYFCSLFYLLQLFYCFWRGSLSIRPFDSIMFFLHAVQFATSLLVLVKIDGVVIMLEFFCLLFEGRNLAGSTRNH